MSIATQPRAGTIYWTAFTDLEGDSEPTDPLRFDMFVERIGNLLLPGITNRVVRVRYFGMVCAGLLLTRSEGLSVRERRHAFLPFERGWALSVTTAAAGDLKSVRPGGRRPALRPGYRGFRGANHVLAYYRRERAKNAINPSRYRLLAAQEAQGGLGSYLVALRRYGFIHPDTLELTVMGYELAGAFMAGSKAKAIQRLLEDRRISLGQLADVGAALTVERASAEEAQLVSHALFEGEGEAAEVVRHVQRVKRWPNDAQSAFESFARRDGDPLARAARFALDFDPLRTALLTLFAELGRQLSVHAGVVSLRDFTSEKVDLAADGARASALVLSQSDPIPGLEDVSRLARQLAETESLNELVKATVAFHRAQGRSWIVDHGGDRYELGRAGSFDDPPATFNGYTMPSAISLLRDVKEAG